MILENESFRTAVYGTFLKNTNPIEKILCYALFRRAVDEGVRVEGFEFTPRTCDELLKPRGLALNRNDLDVLLQNLRVGGMLADVKGAGGGRYRLPCPGWRSTALPTTWSGPSRKSRRNSSRTRVPSASTWSRSTLRCHRVAQKPCLPTPPSAALCGCFATRNGNGRTRGRNLGPTGCGDTALLYDLLARLAVEDGESRKWACIPVDLGQSEGRMKRCTASHAADCDGAAVAGVELAS